MSDRRRLRPPPFPPPDSIWVWSAAHGHYHFREFNQYFLLNAFDQPVIPGYKQAFCLMDVERTDPSAPRLAGLYSCGDQGVSAGWSDVYSSGLPCQFIAIDNLVDGDYRLLATTNYKQHVQEDRFLEQAAGANIGDDPR
jgi:lysyl oxidase